MVQPFLSCSIFFFEIRPLMLCELAASPVEQGGEQELGGGKAEKQKIEAGQAQKRSEAGRRRSREAEKRCRMRSDETTRTDKRRSGKALKEGQGSSGKGEGPQTIAEAEKRSRKRPELRKSSESEKRKSKSAEADDRSRRKAEAHRKLKISKAQQHQNDGRAEERKLRGPERGMVDGGETMRYLTQYLVLHTISFCEVTAALSVPVKHSSDICTTSLRFE
ncbi:hypothetical protein AK812_SmicGene9737 [Symbiodinium microadriaticum]|uniref:Nipped-B-like protein B n=1 Tax=Symbiodinium microadriaticum TaxID=2951 RepID=A0A1Q9EHQ2_SYMMI|nr:hypothetical protein AK812_SmicGene9737 [Symbiodinium microadriaticum]